MLYKGYKFISSRKQEKYAKANCMTTEAHFLETMKKLDFKQCAERQYQQTLVAKNLCWVNMFITCWLMILNCDLESLQLLSKYSWLLTNHADIALDVSHTKLTNMFLAFSFKLLIKVLNQSLHTYSRFMVVWSKIEIFGMAKAKFGQIKVDWFGF